METEFWPLGVYFVAVLIVVGSMLGFSYILGERHRDPATGQPYEAGIVSTGTARQRFSSGFYLVAIFFLVFDLEAVFLYAWAVSARQLGWVGYFEMLVFVAVLLAGLAYIWRLGLLRSPTHENIRT